MGQPRPLFVFFNLFNQTCTILQQCEKCSSSTRRKDSNSQPSDYESPPLTTSPGLPPTLTEKYYKSGISPRTDLFG